MPNTALTTLRRTVAEPAPPPLGPLLSFAGNRGIVTSCESQTLTDVHSTGNVGYIDRHTGAVFMPSVRTDHTHLKKFWLDNEHFYTIPGEIEITTGHDVGVLVANGRVAYVCRYLPRNRRQWWRVTPLPDLLPLAPPASLGAVFGTTALVAPAAAFGVVLAISVLVALLAPVLTRTLVAPTAAGTAFGACSVAFVLTVAPALALLYWFRRGRRSARANAILLERGRLELTDACGRVFQVDPAIPVERPESPGPILPALAAVLLAVAAFIVAAGFHPGPPPNPVPTLDRKLVVGSWHQMLLAKTWLTYAPDGTYTVIDKASGKLLDSGSWNLSGRTIKYTSKSGVSGWHQIQDVDGSGLVFAPDAGSNFSQVIYSRVH